MQNSGQNNATSTIVIVIIALCLTVVLVVAGLSGNKPGGILDKLGLVQHSEEAPATGIGLNQTSSNTTTGSSGSKTSPSSSSSTGSLDSGGKDATTFFTESLWESAE